MNDMNMIQEWRFKIEHEHEHECEWRKVKDERLS